MSEPIKPLDVDFSSLAGLPSPRGEGELSEDELYAPADVSEIAARAASLSVPTLTNSPGCRPSTRPATEPSARPSSEPSAQSAAQPIRHARSVRVDAWSTPAPANWGRSRRVVRKVQGRRGANRATAATPSVDWSLPF